VTSRHNDHFCEQARNSGSQFPWTAMRTRRDFVSTSVGAAACSCDTSSTLPRSGTAPKITSLVSDHLLRARWCGTELFLQFLEPLSHRLDRLEEATVYALAIRIDLILVLHRFEIVDDDGDEQVDDDEDGQ
jgi:hypothetical protein